MVLNYPTTSKEYEIETAQMYRKYWKSIKHFNQKSEQALIGPLPLVSQQSNNKKRKHDEMESTNVNAANIGAPALKKQKTIDSMDMNVSSACDDEKSSELPSGQKTLTD